VAVVIALPIVLVGLVYLWVDDEVVNRGHPLPPLHADTAARNAWIVLAAGMAALIILAGYAVNKQIFGALIDAQNRYSLSRLQVAAWTTVVLSAWLAVVLVRIASNISVDNALKVDIPDAVLVALGISVGSFAFSSGIKDAKRKQEVSPTTTIQAVREERRLADELQRIGVDLAQANHDVTTAAGTAKVALEIQAKRLQTEYDALTTQRAAVTAELEKIEKSQGLLVKNDSPSDATAGDLFRGEEIADANTLDYGKVQMLWITVAVVAAYIFILGDAIAGGSLFARGAAGVSLPDLPDSVVALLGISHGGYLAVKASNSEKAAPNP
jgi:hypothetical protein